MNTASGPGFGITNQTIQYHGPADLYTLNGATSLATLYSNAATATSNPAVTLRSVGTNGGEAAAFTYDLASSIVLTRQGNPAWAGQHRDGHTDNTRSDDQYFGNASGDPQPDYVNLSRDSIPGADEQQRFLANLITQMELAKPVSSAMPLPRFWYFPNGAKAMVLMSGDDHATGGTAGRFDTFLADGTSGGLPIGGSSYIYPNTPLTDAEAATYTADGFEVGLHPNNLDANGNPTDYTSTAQLASDFSTQLAQWEANFPSLPTPSTNRTHAIVWSDYSSEPQVELANRMRLEGNYYYWPPEWIQDQPGLFTGSAMPMHFTTKNGTMIDVYQATSEMTDESGQSYPKNINALLNLANGPQGYYGVFTVNAHTDTPSSSNGEPAVADDVVSTAQLYNNPVLSGRQVLGWLDYRDNSSFGSLSWNATTKTLSFTITTADNASGLRGEPAGDGAPALGRRQADGHHAEWVGSRLHDPADQGGRLCLLLGRYRILHGAIRTGYAAADRREPVPCAERDECGRQQGRHRHLQRRHGPGDDLHQHLHPHRPFGAVPATVTYDTASKTATLTPAPGTGLAFNSSYTVAISGAQDVSHNAINPVTWSFTTGNTVTSTSIWKSPPSSPDESPAPDGSGVELGVKFRSLVAGTITGISFFKGDGSTGTHVGHLWSSTGQLLASATFGNETASGWQTATFSPAVTISPNITYVASYYAPNGNYAATNSYFTGSGVNSWPLQVLADGQDGPTSLYLYGSDKFPTNSYLGSNYWVDVVFSSSSTTAATTTSLGSSLNPSVFGQSVTFTATVSSAPGRRPGR